MTLYKLHYNILEIIDLLKMVYVWCQVNISQEGVQCICLVKVYFLFYFEISLIIVLYLR